MSKGGRPKASLILSDDERRVAGAGCPSSIPFVTPRPATTGGWGRMPQSNSLHYATSCLDGWISKGDVLL
jgi:hypothetical protein